MSNPRPDTQDGMRDLEREVRRRLDEGDVRAAAALVVEGLGPSVRGFLRTLLVESDAAEAYSEFTVNLMKALPGFRWECPLRAWTHRVAFFSASRIWRRPGRRLEEPLPSSLSRLGPGPGASRTGSSGRHAGLALLRESLTLEDQTLLHHRVDLGLPWEEIAAILSNGEEGRDGARDRAAVAGGTRSYAREAAALRKRYERLTARLREEARRHGLLD